MKLTWLGHSCFVIEQDGYRVVLDPYFVESYPALHVSAHETLCSHDHRDHCFTEAVTRIADGRKSPFTVETVDTFHDEKRGTLRGENKMHVLRANGLTVVHAGDLGHALNDKQLAAVKGCDALLLPVGGFFTIDAPAAKKLADAVGARVVVPMHYRFGAHGYDVIGTLDAFTNLYDAVRYLDSDTFELTADAPRGVVVPKFRET